MGTAVQNEELTQDLAERDADMEELANFVSTKAEVIKNMERRMLQAKIVSADLKTKVQSLCSRNDLQESDHQSKHLSNRDRARQLSQSFQYPQSVQEGPSGSF